MPDRKAAVYLTAIASTCLAAVAAMPQTRTLAIANVAVVDVVDGRIIPKATVTVSGQTIVGVTPNGAPPANARVMDGEGKFLIPGLWDICTRTWKRRASRGFWFIWRTA
jgi:adenine deaminase